MSKRLFGVIAISALAASCLWAQKINTEFDQTVDFSKYHTFAVRGGQVNSKNAVLNNDLIKKQIETDIANDLAAKGLKQTMGKADLNVRYHMGEARKTQVDRYPAGWNGMRTRVVRHPYAEGTLVIDLHDSASKSLVWRAIASEDKSNASDVQKKLDDMVRKAIDKFPPKK